MNRRTFLAGTSTAAVVGLAGCSIIDDSSEDTDESAALETVESYIDALGEGEVDRVRSFEHSERDPLPEENIEATSAANIEANEFEVHEQTESSLTVRISYEYENDDEIIDVTQDVELRIEDEEWRVYKTETIDEESR